MASKMAGVSRGVILGALLSSGAYAQAPAQDLAAAPPPEGMSEATIQEIVVTAQKRAENLQDTPLAITALTEDALDRSNVRDFININRIAPDVTVNQTTGSTLIGIRGIRSLSAGPTNESPAAIHLDGVFLSRSTGINGLFYDVQRLEVLKGPQGTLYGRNAVAGVINIISNRPRLGELSFDGALEVANYDQQRVEGAVNLAVGENLAVRVAGRLFRRDGYYDIGLDDANQKSIRGSVLWQLGEDTSLYASGDFQISDRNGPGTAIVEVRYRQQAANGTLNLPLTTIQLPKTRYDAGPAVQLAPSGVAPCTTAVCDAIRRGNLYPFGTLPQNEEQKAWGGQAQLDHDFGGVNWTTQVGIRRVRQDLRSVPIANPANPTSNPSYSFLPQAADTTSIETRLASADSRQFEWVAGLYYFTEQVRGTNCNPATITTPAPAPRSSAGCTLDLRTVDSHATAAAAFGQATFSPDGLDNRLHLTFGGRYNYDKKTADLSSTLFGSTINRFGLERDYKRFTHRIGAAYDIAPANLIYANYSTGYKSGGFAYGSLPEFLPEYITAYEIGAKNEFFNRMLQVNIDAYWYDYKNVQTNVTVPNPNPPFPPFLDLTVVSVGKVRYKGISLQTIFAPTRADRFELNLEHINARYRDYVIPARFSNAPPLDLMGRPIGIAGGVFSGLQVPNTPKISGRAAYSHDFDFDRFTITPRTDVQFAGKTPLSLAYKNTVQEYVRDAYAQIDLSLRVAPANGPWSITAYVNNVTDKAILNTAAWGVNGLITGTYLTPRVYGIIVEAKF